MRTSFASRFKRAFTAWYNDIKPGLIQALAKFKALSPMAKAGVISVVAAFSAGVFGAIGENAWAWFVTPSYVDPGTVAAVPPEMTEEQLTAAFAKRYPGIKLELSVHGGEDGSFESFEKDLKVLKGDWQVSSGIFIGRRFVPLRMRFSHDKILSAYLRIPSCAAEFSITKLKQRDAIVLRKSASSGGWCDGIAGMELSSIVDSSMAMSVYMESGEINGSNILVKSFDG